MFLTASELIEAAVHIEDNGLKCYHTLSETMTDGDVKALFLFLAAEEGRHRKAFIVLLSQTKSPAPESLMGDYSAEYRGFLSAFANHHIFTKDKMSDQVLAEITTPVYAIEFALRFELESVFFYMELKQFVQKNQMSVVHQIISEERSHYLKLSDLLSAQKS
ncbi:MAG: ferritin family protein [Chitinivibrionales bacterium]|nr:ferritin family protein [Chitinivibrionales bacterium]